MSTVSPGQDEPSISERVNKVMEEQERMAVTQAEDETEQQKKRQRAELADHRTKLLKAVKVEAPDLAAPLFEKLSALAHENHEFAPREVVDLLKAHKARFRDEPDFFDLGIAQRADLLDRVGFYRGVVIDHSLSNPVEVGFRDVLMKPDDAQPRPEEDIKSKEGKALPTLQPAQLFYRKPNFSGYFENNYTTSETVFQTQKNGVTNLTFSLGIAVGGLRNSASLGLSYSNYSKQEESAGFVGKTVFTTANFFLPKIELSFDDTKACASRAFYEACKSATGSFDPEKNETFEPAFHRLKKVLDGFGHFIPLQTLVGGRLFATEKKRFEGNEKATDFTDRFGGKIKASLSTVYVDAEADASHEKSKQEAMKQKNSSEAQNMTFNAVGGEGTVVQDAAAWAESLYDYRRWANVQRENLIPTLDLLPDDISARCWSVLEKYSLARTKQALLHEDKAYFLFYGKYGDKAGSKAREVYFSIINNAYDAAVTVKTDPPSQGEKAILTRPETVPTQLWRLTENGQLVLRAAGQKTLHGNSSEIFYALTAELPAAADAPPQDEYPVSLSQLCKDSTQMWDYPGSGELICRALGSDYVLDAPSARSLILKKRSNAGRLSHLWYLAECSESAESSLYRAPVGGLKEVWVQLVSGINGGVLSASLGEDPRNLLAGQDVFEVVVQPDIGGQHQYWRRDESGRFISALGVNAVNNANDLLLSVDDKSGRVIASPSRPELAQKWDAGVDGTLSPRTGAFKDDFLTCHDWEKGDAGARGCALELSKENASRPQKWIIKNTAVQADEMKDYEAVSERRTTEVCDIHHIDETELVINGSLAGLEFFIQKKSDYPREYVLRLKISCHDKAGNTYDVSPPSAIMVEPLTPLYKEKRKVYVSPSLLYLPAAGAYSIRLDCSNMTDSVRMLRLMYRAEKDGVWRSFRENIAPAGDLFLQSNKLDISLSPTVASADEQIIAVGIAFDPRGQKITPKILKKKVKT